MNFYAGLKLYCIDKNHPYYRKGVEVASPYKELKDGSLVRVHSSAAILNASCLIKVLTKNPFFSRSSNASASEGM